MIYFDNAATSLIKPENVKNAIMYSLENYTANPGRSGHSKAIKVAEKIYETRENIKEFFNAKNYSLIFTKNCTEALNLAILRSLKKGDHVITTCYEHNSVLRPLNFLKSMGVEVTIIWCNLGDLNSVLEREIKPNTKMVITTYVSNVTGEICNVKNVGEICKKHGLIYLVDGAQASGHLDVNLETNNIDLFAFAGHKGLLSVTGVGGLLVKNLKELKPIIFGGTGTQSENMSQPCEYEEDFEAGTIPTIPILSLNEGVKYLSQNFQKIRKKEEELTKYTYFSLKKLNFIEIYSKSTSLNVISFNIKNLNSMDVANILNEKYSICVRAGLHCAPLIHQKQNTQKTGAVRVALDFNNTFYEIDVLVNALVEIFNSSH